MDNDPKDAERYRWLRLQDWIDWDAVRTFEHDELSPADLLDTAIDAREPE